MTERVPLSRLRPAAWNPRLLRDVRFKQLCRSLEADPDFLEQRPVLATLDGTVYAGNMRLRAARHLGWTDIPAILTDIPEQLARERALKDNNQFGEWQEQELAELLAELQGSGSDLSLLGFEQDQLNDLLESVGLMGEKPQDPGAQIDRAAELQVKWSTERGQLWTVGRHRLLCGDATNPDDVARLMDGNKPRLMVTDPPYGVAYDPTWRDRAQANRLGKGRSAIPTGDECPHDWSPVFSLPSLEVAYCWAPGGAQQYLTQQMLETAGFIVRQQIIWVKPMAPLSRSAYHWRHEPCWYAVRDGANAGWIGGYAETTVWEVASPTHIMSGSDEDATPHATQKPLECMVRPMRNHEGDVYDPFLGSGTTMVAAEQTGRVCYGMEIEPKYVAVTLERLAGLGLEPKLTRETAATSEKSCRA